MFVSIVIDNYNYGRFLRHAIESALEQTHRNKEVVVVDDGSTDESRPIIASYGDRIRPVLKSNGGQGSAFNAGFCVVRGEVVVFLDSDDRLYPHAVSEIVSCFEDPRLVKAQWLLQLIDDAGKPLGGTRPSTAPPDGDLRERILKEGPSSCPSAPTSGNAWHRTFLEQVMPMPEDVPYYRVCADEYLFNLAPFFGLVRTIPCPLGEYRIHGASIYSARPFDERLRLEIAGHEQQCAALSTVLYRRGIAVDADEWRRHSWFGHLKQAIDWIKRLIPPTERFLLVDGGTWGAEEIFGDRAVPVLERDGQYWGDPPDTAALLSELERQRLRGVRFLVVAWPAFWWFDYYTGMPEALGSSASCIWHDDFLAIYQFQQLPHTTSRAETIPQTEAQ